MKYVSYIFTLIYDYKENKKNKLFHILTIINNLGKAINFIVMDLEKIL